jgi:hypothetical protein
MSTMTERMSQASTHPDGRTDVPAEGEHFRCQLCGMEIEVIKPCNCEDPSHVHFQCCGQEMTAA